MGSERVICDRCDDHGYIVYGDENVPCGCRTLAKGPEYNAGGPRHHALVAAGVAGFAFGYTDAVNRDLDRIGPVWLAERLAAMTDHEVTVMVIDAYMSGNTIPAREALQRHLSRRPSGE